MALSVHLFIHFCCRMYRLAAIHSVTDGRTDRQTTVSCQLYSTACSTVRTKNLQLNLRLNLQLNLRLKIYRISIFFLTQKFIPGDLVVREIYENLQLNRY